MAGNGTILHKAGTGGYAPGDLWGTGEETAMTRLDPMTEPAATSAGDRRLRIAEALQRLAPRLPRFEREAILDHAEDSRGLRQASPENAAWLAMVAYTRYVFTDYDALLAEGYDVDSARHFVLDETNAFLEEWGSPRRVSDSE